MKRVWTPVAVLLILGLAGVAVGCSGSDDASPRPGRADAASVEQLLLLADLTSALQHERTTSSLQLIGWSELQPEINSVAEAREPVDDLRDDVAAVPELRGFEDELAAVRETVDEAMTAGAGAGADQNEQVLLVHDAYGTLSTRVLDIQTELALSVDHPDIRQGAKLLAEGLQQIELLNNVVTMAFEGFVEPAPTADVEWVSRVSAIHTEMEQGRTEISDTRAGSPYSAAVRELETNLDATDDLETVEDMSGGDIEIFQIVDSLSASRRTAWSPFVESVEQSLRAYGPSD